LSGTVVLEEKWPGLGRHVQAAGWLRVWTDLGRAPRTIDAYARGLAEYLRLSTGAATGPTASAAGSSAADDGTCNSTSKVRTLSPNVYENQ
jgi:integrase/recombinase XerD